MSPYPSPNLVTFPDPNAEHGSSDRVFIDPFAFDGSVFNATASLGERVWDNNSLSDYREVIGARAGRVKARLNEWNARLQLAPIPTQSQAMEAIGLYREFAFVALYEGDHDAAAVWLGKALLLSRMPAMPAEIRAHFTALLGINALCKGEQDNCIGCVGPSSCIFPIAGDAVHTLPSGSREAVRWFSAYLDEWPGDLRVRWLLNIATMRLGEYPDKVPPQYGVSFADWDDDGDLDLFVVLGGGYPGDRGYNALFQNPGHRRHWLKVRLVGVKTNRSAIGARLRVDLSGPDGSRSIHRVIGNNGSFGGNTLVESIGLLDAKSVDRLTVTWPTSKTTQTFRNIAATRRSKSPRVPDSLKSFHRPPITLPPSNRGQQR